MSMKIQEILTESTPRTLYHGTLKKFVPTILKYGLMPTLGEFTKEAYADYHAAGVDLPALVFAANRTGLDKCISSIMGAMRHHGREFSAQEFYANAAIIVIKQGERKFVQRGDDFDQKHPATVEPHDYYSDNVVYPDYAIMDQRLKSFLRRNGVRLAYYGMQDSGVDRAELIRQGIRAKPA